MFFEIEFHGTGSVWAYSRFRTSLVGIAMDNSCGCMLWCGSAAVRLPIWLTAITLVCTVDYVFVRGATM